MHAMILPPTSPEGIPDQNQTLADESLYGARLSEPGGSVRQDTEPLLWTPSSNVVGTSAVRVPPLRRMLRVLVPSFLQEGNIPSHASRPSAMVAPAKKLAHLDGLRGIAALVVFFCHMGYSSHDLSYGYGYIGERSKGLDTYHSPFRLPIVRLFYDGDAAVCLFFIISGFALSYKPMRLARANDMAGLANTLASSTLRRGLRLFLPLAVSMLCIAILVQLGVYNLTAHIATDGVLLTAFREPHPVRADYGNIFRELGHWAYLVYDFVQPWHWKNDPFPQYDIHLWTIPVEFRASLALFVVQLGVAKMRLHWRRRIVIAIGVLGLLKDSYVMTLFCAGLYFAESQLIGEAEHGAAFGLPSFSPTHERRSSDEAKGSTAYEGLSSTLSGPRTPPGRIARVAAYFVALFFMSQPFFGEETLFWRTLVPLTPDNMTEKKRFYTTIGCILFFMLSSHSPFFLRVFRSRVAQYLGRISFSLYLVHACVLHTVGYATFATVWSFTGIGEEGYGLFRRELGFVIACMWITPVAIWVADIFTRVVDEPSVRLARTIEKRLCG